MSWGAEYDTACRAADEQRNPPTREQLAFDAHAKAVEDLGREIRLLTQCGPNWPNKGDDRIAKLLDLGSDLMRELRVLSIEGVRPGSEVRPIPTLQQVAIKCATFEQVQAQAAE
jgi:hypothetical protein